MTLVKICGLRDVEHMVAAAEAGADLVGLNFLPTVRRYVPPEDRRRAGLGVPRAESGAEAGGALRGPTRRARQRGRGAGGARLRATLRQRAAGVLGAGGAGHPQGRARARGRIRGYRRPIRRRGDGGSTVAGHQRCRTHRGAGPAIVGAARRNGRDVRLVSRAGTGRLSAIASSWRAASRRRTSRGPSTPWGRSGSTSPAASRPMALRTSKRYAALWQRPDKEPPYEHSRAPAQRPGPVRRLRRALLCPRR